MHSITILRGTIVTKHNALLGLQSFRAFTDDESDNRSHDDGRAHDCCFDYMVDVQKHTSYDNDTLYDGRCSTTFSLLHAKH